MGEVYRADDLTLGRAERRPALDGVQHTEPARGPGPDVDQAPAALHALGDRIDGHVVQGHVDVTVTLHDVTSRDGSWLLTVRHPVGPEWLTVHKGSIALQGISLTVVDSGPGTFTVAIIPYTWEHTNLHRTAPGSAVNLEFDVMGKYVARLLDAHLKTRGAV